MELAAIITTLIVVILQIITIALVVGTRKMVRDQVGKASPALSNDKSGDRKDRDFRNQNRRPAQDQRPKQPTQNTTNTGSVDTVEKSLRDINLKLKNAERDQDFARRRVQENFSKDQNRRHNNNNDRNNRGGNRDNRDHRNNDRNRDRRNGNWQDRNNRSRELPGTNQPSLSTLSEENPNLENLNALPTQEQVINQQQEPVTQAQVGSTTPDIVPNDFNSDELQHGRKIMVKRRLLKEEEEQQSDGSSAGATTESSPLSSLSDLQDKSENTESQEKAADSEIRFGRR